VQNDAALWWAGKLDRPLIQVRLSGYNINRTPPSLPQYDFASFYDFSIPADLIIDRWDYDLSGVRFFGDAFPHVWPNFGPGIVAAFLGASLSNAEHTVWFSYPQQQDIRKLKLVYSRENIWYRRVREILIAANARWKGTVQIGFPDLGGTLDILASFRGSEQLIMDMYDSPDEVKRLIWEIHNAWWQYYIDFETILKTFNPGFTSWEGIFSNNRYCITQCDFAYMLSPQLFSEFAIPELTISAGRLQTCFYHLDGVGQIAHLDSILQIPLIHGIQWIPGAGRPDTSQWPQVYRKIRRAGKLIQLFDFQSPAGFEVLDILEDQLGNLSGILFVIIGDKSLQARAEALLDKYGVHDPSMQTA
jgi:hypothetical protein